ncbi:MAG: hypothetical protein ETSY2_35795 [Candidatus Entotheonella gemina]|uniref:Phosphotyrosine protein phosphatase I domain-containing protein n=1 Tax=Candidatus Entotheonella gemina TaxID=1429439 RepID=W4LW29_9BACT|nr:MAG: hypothetical protein ETSY2_35795 [Candidatus Entotheonella gemina]
MGDNREFHVLFLCTGNSARSIIAECLLNYLGQGKFIAHSAGSQPKGEVNPYALEALQNHHFAIEHFRSKSWDEFSGPDAPPIDFIFTLCDEAARETCPIWSGRPVTAHWGLPDPAAVEGSDEQKRAAFENALHIIRQRIERFINLPLVDLEDASLQQRLDAVGKTTPQVPRS